MVTISTAALCAPVVPVAYYLQLGAEAERIAGILADRGVDVSGRTILRWVQ